MQFRRRLELAKKFLELSNAVFLGDKLLGLSRELVREIIVLLQSDIGVRLT